MTGLDWQDADPTAYDPDNELALLEKAAAAGEDERARAVVWAVRSMVAGGAPHFVLDVVGRDYVKRSALIGLGSYDELVRRSLLDRTISEHAGAGDDGERGPSVATHLVQIAQEFYTFGVSDTGEPFALPIDRPRVVAMLRGGKTSLRALLAREFYTRTGRAPTQQALADALLVIEGVAQDQDESRLYLRAAQHDGALWLDLGDHTGRAVCITRHGWAVETAAPVLFKRTTLTGPLPEPQHGGSLDDLWGWLNVAEDDRPLVAAALVSALFSEQPHVVLAIFGEQGTGKTTAVKVLVSLLDPGPVPVRKPPRDADSWVTAAAGSWVVGLDNLSEIPPWLSDSLCRASTGDGDVRRKLYTDGDYAVFAFRRCIIFDAIDVGALEPDLADRALQVTLALIPDQDRRAEESFWPDWREAHPKLLGAVLDLAAAVLRRLPDVTLERKPRMADFARILAAVDAELGTSTLDRYASQAANLAADGLSGDSLAARILAVVKGPFEGTSAQLRSYLIERGPDGSTDDDADEWKEPKDWPADARAVTGRMRRLAPAFRKTGWTVTELPPGHANAIRWHISPPEPTEEVGEDARTRSQDSHDGHGASDASECEPRNGTSPSAGQERKGCPRHRTRYGAHPGCLDCHALNAAAPRP
jgi:hypothetical protein